MKEAFTLIELLVVVLIIGVLAAIALPQYQVTVEKTRAMKAVGILSILAKGQEVYYLANGSYATNLDNLDIDLPAGGTRAGNILNFSDNFSISLATGAGGYFAAGTKHVQLDIFLEHTTVSSVPGIFCYAPADDEIATRICKSMGVSDGGHSTCGMLPATPSCVRFKIE